MTKSISLSATSALVLLWSQVGCYQTPQAQRYLTQLNLESGRELYDRCKGVWPYYGEVIKNRKYAVFDLMERCVKENKNLKQVVIAGAGLAPLCIDCKMLYPFSQVFDMDNTHMSLKHSFVTALKESNLFDIKFIEVNLEELAEVKNGLLDVQWKPDEPTLLILEGISYYLVPNILENLMKMFRHQNHQSRIIIEYLVPQDAILHERQYIPECVFRIIMESCGLSHITRIGYTDIISWTYTYPLARYTMKMAEKKRTGQNNHFPTENSGWIEICLLAV